MDYILCLTAKFFSAFLRALPLKAALSAGRLFGRFAYIVNSKRAKIAYGNMRSAFCEEKEPSEIRDMVKHLYRNFGVTLVEILMIPRVDKAYIDKYVTVENIHYLRKAVAGGNGVIYLTGHFGNWELSSITSVFTGYPLMVLAREQKMPRLNNALNAYRESKGCKVVKKGMAAREIYDHLGKKGIVGILSDQDAGKKGVFVNFFGRPTSTHRGAFALSQKTGAVIIPAFMVRVNGPYHRLFLESPIKVAGGDEGRLEAIQKFAFVLERYAKAHPEQWLWLHKRWKSTPLRKVLIINDGKQGHFNQSLSIFEKIKECRRGSGYIALDTELKIINLIYKNRAGKMLMSILSPFISRYCLVRMKFMKFCLKEESYGEFENTYADIVISCGSRAAPVNLLFSRENNAKSVVVMKTGLISSSNFDLAIIPEHDSPPERENITATLGAPNLITPERLESNRMLLEKTLDLGGKKNIGLFVGGENKSCALDTLLIKEVLKNVIGAAMELGANVLTATSRRTSSDVSDFLKNKLKDCGAAKLVIVANEHNPEWTVGGILAVSDIVVVSGESSSMLSEAASSGKHVLAFKLSRKPAIRGNNKYDRFLNRLQDCGFVRVSKAGNLKENIIELMNSGRKPKKLDDNKKLLNAVRRVV